MTRHTSTFVKLLAAVGALGVVGAAVAIWTYLDAKKENNHVELVVVDTQVESGATIIKVRNTAMKAKCYISGWKFMVGNPKQVKQIDSLTEKAKRAQDKKLKKPERESPSSCYFCDYGCSALGGDDGDGGWKCSGYAFWGNTNITLEPDTTTTLRFIAADPCLKEMEFDGRMFISFNGGDMKETREIIIPQVIVWPVGYERPPIQ